LTDAYFALGVGVGVGFCDLWISRTGLVKGSDIPKRPFGVGLGVGDGFGLGVGVALGFASRWSPHRGFVFGAFEFLVLGLGVGEGSFALLLGTASNSRLHSNGTIKRIVRMFMGTS
jgi:hypothetical protein